MWVLGIDRDDEAVYGMGDSGSMADRWMLYSALYSLKTPGNKELLTLARVPI